MAAVTSAAGAQQRVTTNQGLTWSIGFAKGSLKVGCSLACEDQKTPGLGVVGHVGWNWKQNLVVGVEGMLWEKAQDLDGDGDNEDVNFNYVGASLQFYPHAFREYFVKVAAGLGQSKTTMDVPSIGVREVDAAGLGFSVGIGYDFHLAKAFSFTPYLDYLLGFKSKANLNGAASNVDLDTRMVQWGIKIVVH
jgi:hypothetical protein